jgi:hypothetical protein
VVEVEYELRDVVIHEKTSLVFCDYSIAQSKGGWVAWRGTFDLLGNVITF